MRLSRQILMGLAVLALLPLLAALVMAVLAGVLGCEVAETGPTPCLAFGTDIGDALSTLMTIGWFSNLTIPFLMLLAGVWALIEAYVRGRRRRKQKRAVRAGRA